MMVSFAQTTLRSKDPHNGASRTMDAKRLRLAHGRDRVELPALIVLTLDRSSTATGVKLQPL